MNRIILLILWLLPLCLKADDGHKIILKIKNCEAQKVRLAYYYEDKQYLEIDSLKSENGAYIIEGEKKLPKGIYSVILSKNGVSFDLLISDNQHFSLKIDANNTQSSAKFDNSIENQNFYSYQKEMSSYLKAQAELDTAKKRSSDSLKIAKIEKDLQILDDKYLNLWQKYANENKGNFFADVLNCMNANGFSGQEMYNHINFKQEGLIRTPFFYKMIRTHIARNIESGVLAINQSNKELIKLCKEKDEVYKYVTAYLLNFYQTFYKIGMNECYIYLAENYFLPAPEKDLAKENRKNIEKQIDIFKSSLVGNKAKNLKLRETKENGDSINILNFKEEYLFLLFWSKGCGHCDSAENAIKFYYDGITKSNIKVLSVNIDRHDFDYQLRSVKEKEFLWTNLCDTENNSRFREYFYVINSPIMYVIDKKGIINNKFYGEENITKAIEYYIKE